MTAPITPLTGQDIIDGFEAYIDDTSSLSESQELALANKIIRKLLTRSAWYFLIKTFTGTLTLDGNGQYSVALPADFGYIPVTSGTTDTGDYGLDKTVFNGPYNDRFKVINYTDRRPYVNVSNYCYIDVINNKLVFTAQPPYMDVSFDYIYVPVDITLSTSPVVPPEFHTMFQHGMAVDGYIIQIFDKDRAYTKEHEDMYQDYIDDLEFRNSQYYSQ